MKRLAAALLATVATFAVLAPIRANAVATQTTAALSSTSWTDLGTGPMRLYGSGHTRYAISDSTPASVTLGFEIGEGPTDVNTTSHVWVISANPSYNAFATYAPITAGGSGGGGGAATIADGADVAEGTTTDTSSANTLIGLTKAIKASTGLSATAALQAAINGDGGSLAHVTNFPATQPVSAVSLPLPTGAATQTTLASILSSLGSPIQATGGSVTANAGTNLNTSLLATDSHLLTLISTLGAAPAQQTGQVVTANPPANQTVTQCAGSITSGGTAQVAIAAQTTLHQFTITNNDATHGSGEPLWISLTTTAAAGGTGSDPLAAPTATSFAGMGSVTIANGTNHAISIFGATTGHTFGCFWS